MRMPTKSEEGTFTVWALCLCLMLFLLAGISVDTWRAFDARRTLTEIADTAARAGASEIDVFERQVRGVTVLDQGLAESSTLSSLEENADLNGVTIESRNVDVVVPQNEVNVEVETSFSFFLLGFLPGASDATLTARSTARPFEG